MSALGLPALIEICPPPSTAVPPSGPAEDAVGAGNISSAFLDLLKPLVGDCSESASPGSTPETAAETPEPEDAGEQHLFPISVDLFDAASPSGTARRSLYPGAPLESEDTGLEPEDADTPVADDTALAAQPYVTAADAPWKTIETAPARTQEIALLNMPPAAEPGPAARATSSAPLAAEPRPEWKPGMPAQLEANTEPDDSAAFVKDTPGLSDHVLPAVSELESDSALYGDLDRQARARRQGADNQATQCAPGITPEPQDSSTEIAAVERVTTSYPMNETVLSRTTTAEYHSITPPPRGEARTAEAPVNEGEARSEAAASPAGTEPGTRGPETREQFAPPAAVAREPVGEEPTGPKRRFAFAGRLIRMEAGAAAESNQLSPETSATSRSPKAPPAPLERQAPGAEFDASAGDAPPESPPGVKPIPEPVSAAAPADAHKSQPPVRESHHAEISARNAPERATPDHAEAAGPKPNRAPAREIALSVNGGDSRVELRVRERRGEIQVAVRTPDAALAGGLRDRLPSLSETLEQAGLKAEAWQTSFENRPSGDSASGGGFRNEDGRNGQDARDRREDSDQNREPEAREDRTEEEKEFTWWMQSLG